MAAMRLRGTPLPPGWLAAVHGLAAASGLVALLAAVVGHDASTTAKLACAAVVTNGTTARWNRFIRTTRRKKACSRWRGPGT